MVKKCKKSRRWKTKERTHLPCKMLFIQFQSTSRGEAWIRVGSHVKDKECAKRCKFLVQLHVHVFMVWFISWYFLLCFCFFQTLYTTIANIMVMFVISKVKSEITMYICFWKRFIFSAVQICCAKIKLFSTAKTK